MPTVEAQALRIFSDFLHSNDLAFRFQDRVRRFYFILLRTQRRVGTAIRMYRKNLTRRSEFWERELKSSTAGTIHLYSLIITAS